MGQPKNERRTRMAAALICTTSAAVSAADLQYEVLGGAAYSDNVERVATGGDGAASLVAGMRLLGAKERGRLRYDLAGDLSHAEYLSSEVPGQTFGSLVGRSSYDIVPQSLTWSLDGSFTQARPDLFRPASPDNLEDVLSLSTGPSVRARFGGALEAQLDARYSLSRYSERPFDSETIGGQLVVGRRATERTLLGLGASYADVTYDARLPGFDPDFRRSSVFVRWETTGVRTSLDLDAGYARAKGSFVDDGGIVLRGSLSRRLTPFVSGFVSVYQDYPTSEDPTLLPFDAVSGAPVDDASVLTATPRLVRGAEIGLRFDRPRTAADLGISRRKEQSLLAAASERTYDAIRASVSRALTPRSRGTLFAQYSREDLGVVAVSADELAVGGQLGLGFGRSLALEIRAEYRDRRSDLSLGEYSELSGGVFLRWGRIDARRGGATVTPPPDRAPVSP